MTSGLGCQFAATALDLVGAPFRLHGRDPRTGLDCVGVVLLALENAGLRVPIVPRYTIRQDAPHTLQALASLVGLKLADGHLEPGDIVALRPGRQQLHLGIIAESGLVHAHAALGRVVVSPAPLPWPKIGQWRPAS